MSVLSLSPGLCGRPDGFVLRRGGGTPLPLSVLSPGCLCTLGYALCDVSTVDSSRQQVSNRKLYYAVTMCPHRAPAWFLTHALSLLPLCDMCSHHHLLTGRRSTTT